MRLKEYLCFACLVVAVVVGWPVWGELVRPRADGLIDDFEGALDWGKRADGGNPPVYSISPAKSHSGKKSLRIEYHNKTPDWGSIEKRVAVTGEETGVSLWLYVESAEPKAAMHIWLFEKDGDGWVQRVHVAEADTLAQFQGRWVEVRLPMSGFTFSPRGRGTQELACVEQFIINCNFGSFVAYVDDIHFDVPPQVQVRIKAEEQRRLQVREEVMKRANWQRSENGNVAIFRDDVPKPEEGVLSDPEYLGELLKKAGYHVTFLRAEEIALCELLTPELFDLLVLPYGPRFPNEAAVALRGYLQQGGRFFSMGGYAFDEPYFINVTAQQAQLVQNGGFETPGDGDMPAGWFHTHSAQQGLVMKRDTAVKHSGEASLHISAPDAIPVTWYIARYRIDKPDVSVSYSLKAKVRVNNIHDGPGAYIAVDFYRANGERISFAQSGMVNKPDTWQELSVVFPIPPDTDHMTLDGVLYAHGNAWFDDFELAVVPASINTRHAFARDMLHISEDQIPVFDPSFRLERVAEVRAADGQLVVPERLRFAGHIRGYSAVGLWGKPGAVYPEPRARWIPLLRGYDEFGHLQGTVGAMMFHHAGPWKGSAWAFFGVTDRDMFARGDEQGAELFLRVVAHLLRGVFLSVPQPTMMCYREGERVGASVLVGNNGRWAQEVTVTARLVDAQTGSGVGEELRKSVKLQPSAQESVEFQWPQLTLQSDLYEIRFGAAVGEEMVDEVSTGFVMWRPEVVARGPTVRWENNYFRLGDERASFLCGTNQTGVVLGPWWENPLVWQREFQHMRDWGLRVLRVLHISHFAGDLERPEEKFLRRLDALVYMCQRHGIILLPCMHDWLGGIAIPEDVLRREARFAQILAERYREVPGIIIDVENEAAVGPSGAPELRDMYNELLRELYAGDEAALKNTWGQEAKFGEMDFKWPLGPDGFGDLRWLDFNLFRRRLVDRWLRANVEAMRSVNRRHSITDEYYLLPGGDAGASNAFCDFVNIHCYGIDHPADLKFYDHSAEGMGFAVGEFSRRSHPSFKTGGWGWAPEREVRRWYLHLLHACLGASGSLACNWDWKDMESCIFPWGLVYPCDLTPKPQFYVFRAVSQLFSHLRLDYQHPEVYVVIPDLHLLGTRETHEWAPARRCIDLLLRCAVSFGVIHDTNLAALPDAARVIFYPCPYAVSERVWAQLVEFVRRGGTVYVSGDMSYDERRRRVHTARVEQLCGVEDEGVVYLPDEQPRERGLAKAVSEGVARQGLTDFAAAPAVRVRPTTAEVLAAAGGQPVLLRNKVEQGQVFFCTDTLEFHAEWRDRSVYRYVLEQAGVKAVASLDEDVVVMLPPQDRGRIAVLYRDAAESNGKVNLLGATIGLPARSWGLVAWDEVGVPYAIEGTGEISAGQFHCTSDGDSPIMVMAHGGSLEKAKRYTVILVPMSSDAYQEATIRVRLPAISQPVGTYGEYVKGQWRELANLAIGKAEGEGWRSVKVPVGMMCEIRQK